MADIGLGDIVARLRLDFSQFQQDLQRAQQGLGQLQQSVQASAAQASQAAQGTTQLAQGLQQVSQAAQGTAQATQAVARQTEAMSPVIARATAGLDALQAIFRQLGQQQGLTQLGQGVQALGLATGNASSQFQRLSPVIQQAVGQYQAFQAVLQRTAEHQARLALATADATSKIALQNPVYVQAAGQVTAYTAAIQRAIEHQQRLATLTTGASTTPLVNPVFARAMGQNVAAQAAIQQAQAQQNRLAILTADTSTTPLQNPVWVQAMGQLTAYQNVLKQTMATQSQWGQSFQSMLQVAGGLGLANSLASLGNAIKAFVTSSIQLSGAMQDLHRSFTAIEGSGSQATATLREAFQIAQQAGVGFQATAEGLRRLEAGAKGTTLSLADTRAVFRDITVGARAMGLSTGEVQHALVALEQMLTKGTLSAEELVRQLGNAIPGGLEKMARGLGITTVELRSMAEGGLIPATVGVTALAVEMRKIGEAAGPLEGFTAAFARLANLTDAWKTALGNTLNDTLIPIMNTLSRMLQIVGELADLANVPEKVVPGWLRGILNLRGLFTARDVGETPQEMARLQPGGVPTPPGGVPFQPSRFDPQIQAAAAQARISAGLLSQLVRAESSFRPSEESKAGALGLTQLMPDTARMLQPGITREQMLEPGNNLRLGATYLAQQLERFKDTEDQVRLALTAYHSGPDTVARLLRQAADRGLPQTLEGISRIPQSRGGLGPEGRAYAGRVLEAPSEVQAARTTEGLARTTAQWQKELVDVNGQFDRLQTRASALATSTENYGGMLNRAVAQQLDSILERYIKIQSYIAAFPEQAKALGEGVAREVAERTQDAAILQRQVQLEANRATLLRQQVEELEQVKIQQDTALKAQQEGQTAAERFRREASADVQRRRLEDQPRRAGLTLQQQMAEDERRYQELGGNIATLSQQLDALQARARRPQLEAELQRVEEFFGRAGRSDPARAREAARVQGESRRAEIETRLVELQRLPGLQDLRARFQQELEGIDARITEQADKAFRDRQQQQQEYLRTTGETIEQLLLRVGAAGMRPLDAELARIRREYAQITADLENFARRLPEIRPKLEPVDQQALDQILAQVQGALPQLGTRMTEALDLARDKQAASVRAQLREAEDAADQLMLRLSGAGLQPLEADLARIRREFAGMLDQLEAVLAKLRELRKGATEEQQPAFDALITRFESMRPLVAPATQRALQERRDQPERQTIETLRNQLERLRTAQEERQGVTAAQRARREGALTSEAGRAEADALITQIEAQERLNYVMDRFQDLGNAVASAWGGLLAKLFEPVPDDTERVLRLTDVTTKLSEAQQHLADLRQTQALIQKDSLSAQSQDSMRVALQDSERAVSVLENQKRALEGVEQSTHRVADAFREMARAILQSMSQIAAQEASKALIKIGFGLLSSLFAPSAPGGNYGGIAQGFSTAALPYGYGLEGYAEGGVVNKPQLALLGENPANNPEYILNRSQMNQVLSNTSNANRQSDQGLSIINVASREEGERQAAQEQAKGRQVVLNYVLDDLRQGSGSSIGRLMRVSQQ